MSQLQPWEQFGDRRFPWLDMSHSARTAVAPHAECLVLPVSTTKVPSKIIGTSITHLGQPRTPTPTVLPVSAERGVQSQLFDALAAMKMKTSEVAMHLSEEWRRQLFKYLDFLHDGADWDERDKPGRIDSFTTFLRLVLFLKPKRRPGMGLTVDGIIVATWSTKDRHLTLECLPNDEVQWSVVVPGVVGVADGADPETAAGRCNIRRMRDVLAPYDPLMWFGGESAQHDV